jgi:hypothetical protein
LCEMPDIVSRQRPASPLSLHVLYVCRLWTFPQLRNGFMTTYLETCPMIGKMWDQQCALQWNETPLALYRLLFWSKHDVCLEGWQQQTHYCKRLQETRK